jgi:two-component system cell cycle sensor histidine kinase/response regulator CckA
VACREAMGEGGEVFLRTENETLGEARKNGERILPAGDYVLTSISLHPAPGRHHAKSLDKNRSLSTAKSILEQNDGFLVSNHSRAGQLEIDIRFPGATETAAGEDGQSTPKRTSKSAEILLVEDDSSMRQFAKAVLSRLGHHVVEAADGEAALRLFEENPDYAPDLLVADMVMPRLGGIELVEKISRRLPETPVLFISGFPEQQAIAQKAGYAFLKKPFAIGELISRTGSLLGD